MKYALILIYVTFLSSCIISINENDYRILSDKNTKRIKQFADVSVDQVMNYDSSLFLYEIDAVEVKNCTKNQKYTWIHLWRPYCTNEYCQNISYFSVIEEQFESVDLELLMVSETYNFKEIDTIVKNSNYQKPIFVLRDSYYGSKLIPTSLKFFYELNPNGTKIGKRYGAEDYLFKDTELIFTGRNLNETMIDSLIQLHDVDF